MSWHDFGLPIAVLAVGLMFGLVVALRARGGLGSASRDRLCGLLRARKEELIAKLVELEGREDRDSEAWLADVLPLREAAANCLRDLEGLGEEVFPKKQGGRRHSGMHLRWGLASFGVLAASVALMVFLVTDAETDRMRPVGERVAEAQEILEANPRDIEANNLVSYWNLNQLIVPYFRGVLTLDTLQNFAKEQGLAQRLSVVEELEPTHPQHILNRTIATALVGSMDDPGTLPAVGVSLSELSSSDLEPSVLALWRSFYRYVDGDRRLARTALESVDEGALNEIETRVHTLLKAKLEAQVMARVQVVRGDRPISSDGGLIYITIRDSQYGGMPFAGKRVGASWLTRTIELDEQDLLPMQQGQPWPDPFWIHAYYDADGRVEIGKAEQDPGNVFAEPLGPFSAEDAEQVHQLTLSRMSEAALVALPSVESVVQVAAPWPEWEFDPFEIETDAAGEDMSSRAMQAMADGRLAEAVGWLSQLQERGANTPESWLAGCLLHHLLGNMELADARLGLLREESKEPIIWLWSAWMAVDRGDEQARRETLLRAEELSAPMVHPSFFAYVSELEVQTQAQKEPVPASENMVVTVELADGVAEADLDGTVWVVVRAPSSSSSELNMIAWARLTPDDLPFTVGDAWEGTGPSDWPQHVWVDAYVSDSVGRERAQVLSPREGPLRRSDSVTLVMEPPPPEPPPGHP